MQGQCHEFGTTLVIAAGGAYILLLLWLFDGHVWMCHQARSAIRAALAAQNGLFDEYSQDPRL